MLRPHEQHLVIDATLWDRRYFEETKMPLCVGDPRRSGADLAIGDPIVGESRP